MYLVIFPEGTRYNPEIPKVIADSQSFAEKEGRQKNFLRIFFCYGANIYYIKLLHNMNIISP